MLDERGIDAAEMARRMREAGAPTTTEEDIITLMMAQPGEAFLRVADAVEDIIPREN